MDIVSQLVALFFQFVDLFLHLDVHLNQLALDLGIWLYVVLFAVIFCETGLVVTPFLPGDSLLFATGALAAGDGSPINLNFLLVLLIGAAILGDAVNYGIGFALGPRVFQSQHSRWLNPAHLERTNRFFERYGGKTIVLARFVPIVRTLAPFVAGIGRMSYRRFAMFNVVGGIVWVSIFLIAGYFLGNLPAVKTNFHIVIVAIILISVAPAIYEFVAAFQLRRSNPLSGAGSESKRVSS